MPLLARWSFRSLFLRNQGGSTPGTTDRTYPEFSTILSTDSFLRARKHCMEVSGHPPEKSRRYPVPGALRPSSAPLGLNNDF